jgi:hypothetical protein
MTKEEKQNLIIELYASIGVESEGDEHESQVMELYAKSISKPLVDRLGSLMRSMAVHPDCVEGSEFADLSSLAQDTLDEYRRSVT